MSVKTLYNPASLSKPELIESFVVRTKSFEKIFSDIRSSDMKYPEKHYLIQGQRGMGKTTLLLRLKYEIENSSDLNSWLLPVFFGEESYDLTSLSRLWEKLLDFLDDALNTDGEFFNHTAAFIDFEDYEKRCFDFLVEVLQKNKKKLIIFFDNFGQLFLDNIREKEKRRLREILMHCSELRIIGASAIVLQDLHDYSEPFYEFFQIVRLEGLTKEETYQLIERLQEKSEQKIDLKKSKGKIDTLGILTGGVIRTLMMVYQVLLEDKDGSALNDLETILDQITPLYKSRIEELPVQQRRIVDVIAKNWDALSTKEIADRIREDGKKVQTKLISAQLAQLEKNNVIEKKQTNTKNHLYQVKERFFNIWYLMRNGDRKDKMRVKWLTSFLEMWYEDQESIESFLELHIRRLQSGLYNSKSALLLANAMIDFQKVSPSKLDQLIEATSSILTEDQKPQFNYSQLKFALAARAYENGDLVKGIDILERIKNRTNSHSLLLSFFYFLREEVKLSEKEAQKLHDINQKDLNFLLSLCVLLKSPTLLKEVLDKSPNITDPEKAYKMGEIFYELGERTEAEKYFLMALDLGYIHSCSFLAKIYSKKDDLELAEKYYEIGLKNEVISQYDVIDFYISKFRGKTNNRRKDLIEQLQPSDPYYNFYHALEILSSNVELNDENFSKMVSLFEKSISDFDAAKIKGLRYQQALGNAIILNFGVKEKKEFIGELILRLDRIQDLVLPIKLYLSMTFAWLGMYTKCKDILNSKELIDEVFKTESHVEDLNEAFLILISKLQYHTVHEFFLKYENLKELLKPTYFALMTLLKEDYPNEVIKMGEELIQPVNDILKRIEEMKLEYA